MIRTAFKKPLLTLSGGTVTTNGVYEIHTFTSTETLIVQGAGIIGYILTGGGGAGCGKAGRGGNGGQVLQSSSAIIPYSCSISITIGLGGVAITSSQYLQNENISPIGSAGGSTILYLPGNTITALGGTAGTGGGVSSAVDHYGGDSYAANATSCVGADGVLCNFDNIKRGAAGGGCKADGNTITWSLVAGGDYGGGRGMFADWPAVGTAGTFDGAGGGGGGWIYHGETERSPGYWAGGSGYRGVAIVWCVK